MFYGNLYLACLAHLITAGFILGKTFSSMLTEPWEMGKNAETNFLISAYNDPNIDCIILLSVCSIHDFSFISE